MNIVKGTAACDIREFGGEDNNCCEGIVLTCFGCHPNLLALGIPCRDQDSNPVDSVPGVDLRDCFCDSSCIKWGDCCEDHSATCSELYTTILPPDETTFPTTTGPDSLNEIISFLSLKRD